MKRATWFVGGVAAGAFGTRYAKRRVARTAAQFAPVNVARSARASVRRKVDDLTDAVREGRQAMADREDELKAKRDGRLALLGDHVGPDDDVLVDGRPVDPDRVAVMRRTR